MGRAGEGQRGDLGGAMAARRQGTVGMGAQAWEGEGGRCSNCVTEMYIR